MRERLGLFFIALTAVRFLWIITGCPKPRGRTYKELDMMFELHLNPRELEDF